MYEKGFTHEYNVLCGNRLWLRV